VTDAPGAPEAAGGLRVPLSVVIPCLDEADQITECVRHLGWADEVLVADGGSSDGTAALARAAGATVLEHTGPTIAAQRNAAIGRARNEWVFALDADERIPPALQAELADVLRAPAHRAYHVRRRNFYLGRELTRGRWGKDWVVRLFTRERRYVERRVHEALERVPDPGALRSTLVHIPYRDLAHQLAKMSRYARWGAEDMFERGERASFWDLSARPAGRFLRSYLLQGAVLDGRFGLVSSALGGYTAFLKYAHLWALEARKPDR
jgi:glycosyltransferase involved in cell wall biosynthesis